MSDSTKNGRFQMLVMPHLDSAFNLACWLTRSRHDAEDLVQEACLRAFRFLDGFHGEDARAWLLTIVRNTFYTWYQERHAQPQSTAFDEDFHSPCMTGAMDAPARDNDPEKLLMRKDSERQLQRGLAALPLEFREVMVMRELEDLSYKQIAGIVGIPIGTVMSRLGRGRKLLARILAPGNQEE